MRIFNEIYMPNKLEDYNIYCTYHKGMDRFDRFVDGCWIMLRLMIDGLGIDHCGRYEQKTPITAVTEEDMNKCINALINRYNTIQNDTHLHSKMLEMVSNINSTIVSLNDECENLRIYNRADAYDAYITISGSRKLTTLYEEYAQLSNEIIKFLCGGITY